MIKNKLNAVLADRKISLRQLSKEIGVHYTTLYRFANEESKTSYVQTLDKVCDHLNVSVGDLLEHRQ